MSWPVHSRNTSHAARLIFRSFSGASRNKGVPGVSHEEKHKRAGPEKTKTDWDDIDKNYRAGMRSIREIVSSMAKKVTTLFFAKPKNSAGSAT